MSAPIVVADVVRSGFVEGHHYGSVVVTDPDGAVTWSRGVVDRPMFPRSCNKPLQVIGMLAGGLALPPPLLALAGASHSGERFHLDGVRKILAGAGLDETALQTPPAFPLDEEERTTWLRAGRDAAAIGMNCSGKHAAMLATCAANGWPTRTYRDPEHPLQRTILGVVERDSGERVAAIGVDGCGAPLLAISLTGLARAFGRIAAAPADTAAGHTAAAYRTHPEYVSGTRRDEAALMRSVPGLFCKGGAEAVFALGLADGRGVALKIEDGGSRARPVVAAAVLVRLGVDNGVIRRQLEFPLLGGGEPVGAVRPAADLVG